MRPLAALLTWPASLDEQRYALHRLGEEELALKATLENAYA